MNKMQFYFTPSRHHVVNTDGVAICCDFLYAALPKRERALLDAHLGRGVEITASKHAFPGAIRILFVNPCKGFSIFENVTTPWLQSGAFRKRSLSDWYRDHVMCPLHNTNQLIKDTFFPDEESLMGCVLWVSARMI